MLKKSILMLFLLPGLFFCSNFSLNPEHITGEDAHNRVKLAFEEFMPFNAAGNYLTLMILGVSNPLLLPGNMIFASMSADNWASGIVDKNKYYQETEVVRCVNHIKSTGALMTKVFNVRFAINPTQTNLLLSALVPNMAENACNLKPVPDFIIISSGTEKKKED